MPLANLDSKSSERSLTFSKMDGLPISITILVLLQCVVSNLDHQTCHKVIYLQILHLSYKIQFVTTLSI